MLKYNKELDCDFYGIEACYNCGLEFDFVYNPMKPKLVKCSHCGTKQYPCSLCDCHIVNCGESEDCFEKIAYVLEEYNKEESEELNMVTREMIIDEFIGKENMQGDDVLFPIEFITEVNDNLVYVTTCDNLGFPADIYKEKNGDYLYLHVDYPEHWFDAGNNLLKTDEQNDDIYMSVYYDTIDADYKGDDNIAYIKANRDIIRDYYDCYFADKFHSKIGVSTFENWLIEFTADNTLDLFIFLLDRDAIKEIIKPDGEKINGYKDLKMSQNKCKGVSFVSDKEKMIDFFVLSKSEFLKFYSYLSEDDYVETEKEVIKKSGYWNDQWVENNPDYDGRHLKDICLGMMIQEWLTK